MGGVPLYLAPLGLRMVSISEGLVTLRCHVRDMWSGLGAILSWTGLGQCSAVMSRMDGLEAFNLHNLQSGCFLMRAKCIIALPLMCAKCAGSLCGGRGGSASSRQEVGGTSWGGLVLKCAILLSPLCTVVTENGCMKIRN